MKAGYNGYFTFRIACFKKRLDMQVSLIELKTKLNNIYNVDYISVLRLFSQLEFSQTLADLEKNDSWQGLVQQGIDFCYNALGAKGFDSIEKLTSDIENILSSQ